MSETTLIVLGAIGFLAAGIGLGFWFSQLRMRGQSAKAGEVQQQFDDYRREVTQHFGQTAEHFKAIGREYRELYEHMAGGADSLCDREALDTKLSFAPKAILESIAEEREEPEATEETDEPIAAESKKAPEKAPAAEADSATDDTAARTLH
ncbi:MAG TPA: DUF1043 family protein [Woeseiaceae bacterium]|nr:DUF1043 family protein [Woeseiaceae bacterium]